MQDHFPIWIAQAVRLSNVGAWCMPIGIPAYPVRVESPDGFNDPEYDPSPPSAA